MEKTQDILGKAIRGVKHPRAALVWLQSAWPSIVGEKVAARTRPVRCSGGILEISADGKEWRRQLVAMEDEFRRRINGSWGGGLVSQIRFFLSKPGPKPIPRELDNDHTPFVRTKRASSKEQ